MANQFPQISQSNRQAAIEAGQTTYESGTPCKRCSSFIKYVSSMGCYPCNVTKGIERLKNLAPEVQERYTLTKDLSRYNITFEEYEAMNDEQGGLCAICGEPPSGTRFKRLCVDHSHTTGHNRGLLCTRCNLGLGYFRDDLQALKNAIAYLEKSELEHAEKTI